MDGSVQIPFQARPGGLIIRLNNRDIVEKKAATFKAVADLIKSHQAGIALVDMRGIPGEASFLDRFEMGEMSARHLPRISLAVLIREDQVDRGQIGIMVAANRGMRIEIFTDEAAAEAWFAQNSPPAG